MMLLSCVACTSASDQSDTARNANVPASPADMTSSSDAAMEGAERASGGEPAADASNSTPGAESVFANVTAVTASGEQGAYTFAVTVESSDVDCSQFADWWEVLSEHGTLLYRRILAHSHTDENGTTDPDGPGNSFTRSGGTVNVTAEERVVVRAHMNNAGYVGQVMSGSVAAGFFVNPEFAREFATDVESQSPQPGECLF